MSVEVSELTFHLVRVEALLRGLDKHIRLHHLARHFRDEIMMHLVMMLRTKQLVEVLSQAVPESCLASDHGARKVMGHQLLPDDRYLLLH
jgi:hypothetical protein